MWIQYAPLWDVWRSCFSTNDGGLVQLGVWLVSPKKWDLFYDKFLHQIKHKSAGCMFYLKGGIHISVWSTTKCLYDIREPRYKQIKMGYQILKKWILDNLDRVLKSHVSYHFAYFPAPLFCTEMGLNMKHV